MSKETEEIVMLEMSEFDYMLINHVRQLRIQNGLTQLQLTQQMKLADGFVSKVETLVERAKYSIRHLPLLAKAFNCTISEVLPEVIPKYDVVIITLKRTFKINKDGSISTKRTSEVISIEPKS